MKTQLAWAFTGQYLNIVIQTIAVLLLARILTPMEIGTYAIAGSIYAVGHGFRDLGIANYLIREETLTPLKMENALFFSWVFCLILSYIIIITSESIGSFFNNQNISIILSILAINLSVIPLGMPAQIYIRRKLQFKKLALIESLSNIAHLCTAIVFAVKGFGAISLAFASISSTFTTILLLRYFSPIKDMNYHPKIKGSLTILPKIITIGGTGITNMIALHSPAIIIGKLLSEASVAFYDKANSLIKMLDDLFFLAINKFILPYFTHLKKNKGNLYEAYLIQVSLVVAIVWPMLVWISINSEYLILFLFGSQWVNSVPLVPYLAIIMGLLALSKFYNELLISLELEKNVLFINIFLTMLRVIIVIVCSPYGLIFLVKGLIIESLFRLFITSYFLVFYTKIMLLDLLSIVIKGFSITILCYYVIEFIQPILFDSMDSFFTFLVISIVYAAIWLLLTIVIYRDILSKFIKKNI